MADLILRKSWKEGHARAVSGAPVWEYSLSMTRRSKPRPHFKVSICSSFLGTCHSAGHPQQDFTMDNWKEGLDSDMLAGLKESRWAGGEGSKDWPQQEPIASPRPQRREAGVAAESWRLGRGTGPQKPRLENRAEAGQKPGHRAPRPHSPSSLSLLAVPPTRQTRRLWPPHTERGFPGKEQCRGGQKMGAQRRGGTRWERMA